ncbi:MAG TPA: hypothetical protein VHT24_03030 [Pseudacidobacterium sp.]|jgi:hypothetical protein|nr:hypothetical protein [Pseudacidobacterium sp.]
MKPTTDIHSWLAPLACWNWKCAILAALLRGVACILALRHAQPLARQHFGMVEMGYVLLTSGMFSGWQQQSLRLKPRYFAWLMVVVVLPLASLGADAFVHLWLDSIKARSLGIGALAFTLLSAMFHWHVMQNGAMLVGESSNSLWDDLKRVPNLLLTFVCSPFAGLRTAIVGGSPGREFMPKGEPLL